MLEKIQETAAWLKARMKSNPKIAIVLGTGLGELADSIDIVDEWPYTEIPNFPLSTVEGHAGKLILGTLNGTQVLALDGRFHYYEGYTMKQVTFPERVFFELGIRILFVSNASGGVNPSFRVGDLMVITDHINFLPENPLRGKNVPTGPRFPDMSEAYSKRLVNLCLQVAEEENIELRQGIYLATQGPTYETPAEYRMYRLLGADAVGMSTVPEVIVARHQGMEVFGMSVITNAVAQQGNEAVSHDEVQRSAMAAGPRMSCLFSKMIGRLAADI